MFLTENVGVSFDGLDFVVKIPDDEQLTAIFTKSQELQAKDMITPLFFRDMAALIEPNLVDVPQEWTNMPSVTKARLLFEISKFILNESLTIPDLKKK